MNTRHSVLIAATALLIAISDPAAARETDDKMSQGRMNAAQVEKQTAGWPTPSLNAIKFLTDKYGPPAAVTADVVIWGKTGPWKRTLVFRTEAPHQFPIPHTDVMQQYIDYKAPFAKYDELAEYDGSVVLERTAGEMSARCDKEPANFLALNLADEVATGKTSVADARKKYGEQIAAMMAKKPAPYTEKLLFTVSGGTQDPDKPLPDM